MKIIRALLLGAGFLVSASAAASAADVYQRGGGLKDAPVDYLPAITWTGFYVGGHVGAAFNNGDNFFVDDADNRFNIDDDDTAFLAGVHVGYNWQKPSGFVLGVEGDVSFADNIDYLASVRARLGYASGQTLVYATGGAAFLGPDDSFRVEDNFFSDDDTETGWVAGVGFEYKIRQNVSFGLEGLYYNFDNGDDHLLENGFTFHQDDADFWVVRARLNYHFNSPY